MDQLSRELELSMFLGIHMKNNRYACVEVMWTTAVRAPIIGEVCTVEYGGVDDEYTGTVVGLREGQVSVRYVLCPRHESTRRSAVGRCEKEKDIGKEKPDRRKPKKRR